ncbi:MAG: hypothetical protein JF599_09625 [Verrucomicrobia bacterium]|nr:hypothetical protein [Verrucomicrobiota bacterium]
MFTPIPAPASSQLSTPVVISHCDVLWGKPVFRAPDLPARVNVSSEITFTPLRVTDVRKTR